MKRYSTNRTGPRTLAMVIALAAIVLVSGAVPLSGAPDRHGASVPTRSPPSAPGQVRTDLQPLPVLADDGNLTMAVPGGGSSTLVDSVGSFGGGLGSRSYTITLRASYPIPSAAVELTTDPVSGWADPTSLPGGPDALPGLGYWSWTVGQGAVNDTVDWTSSPSADLLSRVVPWTNTTFTIAGSTSPVVDVSFNRTALPSGAVVGAGFSVNAAVIGARNGLTDPTLAGLASALHPALVRAGLSTLGTIGGWNNTTGAGTFNYAGLDQFLGFARNLSAEAYVSLPAGTWGDGNLLPSTFPVNTSLPVTVFGSTGWFPAPAAYATLIGQVAEHVATSGENVTYWNVGNEVPVANASMIGAFVADFNAAAGAIHAVLPGARVGSDVMLDPTVLPTFAADARGVGFLAFHYYPAQSVCVVNRTLCPAGQGGLDLTDGQIWEASSGFARLRGVAAAAGQQEWHNLTGTWLPVLDAESNLNTAGGNAETGVLGTDPRQQTLFGAAWTISTLIDATAANVSRFDYYALACPPTVPATVTGPYGGWGFGLVGLGPQGNVTHFAPWWALEMWGSNVPSGVGALPVTVSDSALGRAIAVRNGTGDTVVLVNRVDTPVTFRVADQGAGAVPILVSVLDRTTYVTVFNASEPRLSVVRTGVSSALEPAGTTVSFTVQGYGVALVLFGAPLPPPPPAAPPLLSTSTFFEATLLGGVAAVATTVIVVYRPRRRRGGDGGTTAPGAPRTPESEDEL